MSARRKIKFGFGIWSCGLLAVAMAVPGFSPESEAGQGWPGIQMDARSIAIHPVTLSTKAMAKKQAPLEMARRGRASRISPAFVSEFSTILIRPFLHACGVHTATSPASIGRLLAYYHFRRGPPPAALRTT